MHDFPPRARLFALLLTLFTLSCYGLDAEQFESAPGEQASAQSEAKALSEAPILESPAGAQPLPGTDVLVLESEPNSSMETANQMNLGDDYVSDYSSVDDEDYVRFTLAQQTQIRIRALFQTQHSSVVLYSSSGAMLASDYSSNGDRPPLIDITLEAGTYFIRVGDFESFAGRQTLELRQLGTPRLHRMAVAALP
ncbi:MAG TPA: PPC domain-containing protein [Myxococcaceae bacterium]|nr:PPC domain-containing protein [Myxococcaceae bacterium]